MRGENESSIFNLLNMKDPAFLFYPNDWLGGTMLFSRLHKGAYMDVLMAQFNHGHMALEDIETLLGDDFNKVWAKLKTKLNQDENGLYYNDRLDQEINKRKAYTESRRQNLSSNSSKKKSIPDNHMEPHMDKHMENENRNENRSINRDENSEKKHAEIFEEFRSAYPGTKRGHETEFDALKKHKDWREILPTLKRELQRQYYAREENEKAGQFVPGWKHLKTYIAQRGWEEEITINNQTPKTNGTNRKVSDSREYYQRTVAGADELIKQFSRERRNAPGNEVRAGI